MSTIPKESFEQNPDILKQLMEKINPKKGETATDYLKKVQALEEDEKKYVESQRLISS